jgi:3-oxoacyl-[acyl-carrier-protein] synthase-1
MHVFLGEHNIISPLGYTSEDNFGAIAAGRTAISEYSGLLPSRPVFCAKIEEAGLSERFALHGDPAAFTRLEQMCILSVKALTEKTGLDLRNADTLLLLSTTKGNIDLLGKSHSTLPERRVYLPEFAGAIGGFFGAAHHPLVISNACISGLLSLIIARRLIEHGLYRNIIVCGADLVSEFTLSGFGSFNALSNTLCRPFDAGRTGINLGEAAASIVLSKDPVSGLVISSGASANDANHISGPSRSGDGLYQAIMNTLNKKGTIPSIDFICAHGTATEYNDEMEAIAFSRAGLGHLPLNSLKGYYGHTLGAAGVLESIICLQSLSKNILLRSAGFEVPGTSVPLNIITRTAAGNLKTCLKTASGFGGCNASALFEKI